MYLTGAIPKHPLYVIADSFDADYGSIECMFIDLLAYTYIHHMMTLYQGRAPMCRFKLKSNRT